MNTMLKYNILPFLMLLATAISGYSQIPAEYSSFVPDDQYENPDSGAPQYGIVLAQPALRLRNKPAFDGTAIASIPFGSKVRRLSPRPYLNDWNAEFSNENRFSTPDGVWGWWEEVEWEGKKGYAFNAYIGQGILKMTQPWYLIVGEGGYCRNDTYYDPSYNFYALSANPDGSSDKLQKFTPSYYASHSGNGQIGSSVRTGLKRAPLLILATKETLPERVVEWQDVGRTIFSGFYDDEKQQLATDSLQTLTIPGTTWEIVPTAKPGPDGKSWQVSLSLRDKKSTGKEQSLLSYPGPDAVPSEYPDVPFVFLRAAGDLDGDRKNDFMVNVGGIGDEWTYLFLTRPATAGKMVFPIVTNNAYCEEFIGALHDLSTQLSEDAIAIRNKIQAAAQQPLPASLNPAEKMLAGQKSFGSHWLTDKYGASSIVREKGQWMFYGLQHDRDNRSLTLLSGPVRIIDDRNFEVTGELRLEYAADGEYKILKDTFLFRRIGNRKFWRLKQPETSTGIFEGRYHYIDVFMEFNRDFSPNWK